MKTTCLKVGLRLTLNEVKYEIVKVILPDTLHLERCSDGGLISQSRQELLAALGNGTLVLDGGDTQEPMKVTPSLESLSEGDRKTALLRYEFVSAAIKAFVTPCLPTKLQDVIAEVAAILGIANAPSPTTVYGWWKRYEASGNDVTALVNRKPGKCGIRAFCSIVVNEMRNAVNNIYLTPEKRPAIAAYHALRQSINLKNERRVVPLRCPSLAQFYRFIAGLCKFEVMAAREGKKAAEAYFRASGKGVSVQYILERAEIDHSPLDVFVIDEASGLALGRPYITAIVDSYSRMLLGWFIGFEPPSSLSVMRALRHAIMPKPDSPTYGIPSVLVCDNGSEFHSDALKRLCAELGMDLQYCPKRQPHYKGKIERALGTVNHEVCQQLSGTSFSNIEARGDYDAIGEATVTLDELKSLLQDWIQHDYSQRIHRGTRRVPAALWTDGLQVIEPNLPESSLKLEFAMTQEAKRVLTHKGIEIFNLFYNSPASEPVKLVVA